MADSGVTDLDALLAEGRAFLTRDPEPDTRQALRDLMEQGDVPALVQALRTPLSFGTAGLRGTLGPGPGHMNLYVVERTTAALCRHLLQSVTDAAERGLCIGYDARHQSLEFAHAAARVALGQGVRVRLFERPGPTPLLAFAVTVTRAAAGVMVTASHNPPAYNGYKVYNSDGAQITTPDDTLIAAQIDTVADVKGLPREAFEEAGANLQWLGRELEDSYLERITRHRPYCEQDELRIAYTPLHGVGGRLCMRALGEAGFEDVHGVKAQFEPDPDFPTVAFPNPEEAGAMDLVLALGERLEADLAIANDPDADRLALAARDESGQLRMLTGNEVGVLLCDYLLAHDAAREDARQALMCCSIVSTPMALRTARAHGAHPVQTLTGFKWICNEAIRLEQQGFRFVFGFEEALGYAMGHDVRDKDGIAAAVIAAQLAACRKARGETLWDALGEISRRDGCYVSGQYAAVFDGPDGSETIRAAVDRLRTNPPATLAGLSVSAISDLQAGTRTPTGGQSEPTGLPKSNVILLEFSDGDRLCVRPSGTEPKLKLYFDVCVQMDDSESFPAARARARSKLNTLQDAAVQHLGLG